MVSGEVAQPEIGLMLMSKAHGSWEVLSQHPCGSCMYKQLPYLGCLRS